MEMIYIAVLTYGFAIDVPNGTRHATQPRLFTRDAANIHAVDYSIRRIRSNRRDGKARSGKGAAFFAKNAIVERSMHGRHVNDFWHKLEATLVVKVREPEQVRAETP